MSSDPLPSDLISLAPEYPDFSITPDGMDVYRTTPAKRGRRAGEVYRLNAQKHPRGQRWYVMLTTPSGTRKRASFESLQELVRNNRVS